MRWSLAGRRRPRDSCRNNLYKPPSKNYNFGALKSGNVREFRVGSLNYWTTNSNTIIISEKKERILGLLGGIKKMSEIAEILNVDDKSISKRLKELEKLNLVEKKDGI